MEGSSFVVVAALVLGYGLVSQRIRLSVVSPPMVFVAAGVVVGAAALGILEPEHGARAVHVFAEVTLIVVLFTDAAHVDLRVPWRDLVIPVRLLAVGMPLTIGFGALLALGLFPWLSLFDAALVAAVLAPTDAAVLAPTDAALGQAVVTNPVVPQRVRQALNVESGLNDGIALPLVLALAACSEAMGQGSFAPWLGFTAKQLLFGPLVGAAVGFLGGRAADRATRAGWMNESFHLLSGLAIAILAYGGAELIHGNGFIATWVAGLVVGNTVRGTCGSVYEFAEAEGQLLSLITFLLFGAVLLPAAAEHWSATVFLYAVLSLTVVRMLPVTIGLVGMRMRPVTHLFLGWFGPRGLASILFALLILDRMSIEHREAMVAIVVATVLVSVVAHGVSASPAAAAYGRAMARCKSAGPMPEHAATGRSGES